MADKLLAVQRSDYFDRLSYEMLAPVIAEFNLQIPVRERDGASHLVFRTEPEHRWRILRLVDDECRSRSSPSALKGSREPEHTAEIRRLGRTPAI